VAHVGVLGHAPVALVQVLVDGFLDVEEGLLLVAQLAAFFAVDDVFARHGELAHFHEHQLDHVLHVFLLGDVHVRKLGFHLLGQATAKKRILDAAGGKRLEDGLGDAVS